MKRFGLICAIGVIFVLTITCAACAKAANSGSNSSTEKGGVPIRAENSPDSSDGEQPDGIAPALVSSEDLSDRDLERIGENLGIDLSEGANARYEVGRSVVRANNLVPNDEDDLLDLWAALFDSAGTVNAVLLGTDRVYEVISDDPWAAGIVIGELELAPLQAVKLTPFAVQPAASLVSEEIVTGADMEDVANRLDMQIRTLINQTVEISGARVKVNYILPPIEMSGQDALDAMKEIKENDEGLFVKDGAVVEVIGNENAIEVVSRCLFIEPPSPEHPARYDVIFNAIPIAHENYMKQNELSVAAAEGASERELKRIDSSLEFGQAFPFFTNAGESEFDFGGIGLDPIDDSLAIGSVESEASGEMREVEVKLTVETGRDLTEGPANTEPYLEPNEFWPADDPEIQRIVDDALENASGDTATTRDKVTALHAWMRENLEYGGDVIGSRWGVEKVLEEGQGRCWDFSDVFITLARAAGIPARQIGGWLYGSEGHIWSQVWLADEGRWLDIDATADRIGVTSYYIPIWGTRDGEMMFLYRDFPVIERLER
jgi:hypothetical protein